MKAAFVAIAAVALGLLATACGPKVGSPEWCQAMDQKPKGDWTANEAKDYAANCLLRQEKN